MTFIDSHASTIRVDLPSAPGSAGGQDNTAGTHVSADFTHPTAYASTSETIRTTQHLDVATWTYPPRVVHTSHDGSRVAGEPQQPAHPPRPLLLIHGFRGDHHGMDLIAHHVRHHEVIVPDLPGFGATPPPTGQLTLNTYLDVIEGLHEHITRTYGLPPLVIGHSFGSILTAHWAARRTTAPDALALINPITSPPLEGPSRIATRAAQLYYALGRALPATAGNALLAHPAIVRIMSEVMATTKDRGLRRYIHDQHAQHFSTYTDRDSLAQTFDISVSTTVAQVVDKLTMPVLVIAGDADQIAPPGPTREFIAQLAHPTVKVLHGVGHLVHYEKPEAAAAAIERFAADVAGPVEGRDI